MELVVVGRAVDLLGEEVARLGVVARLHRGDAEVEELERRIRLEQGQLGLELLRLGELTLEAQRLGQVGHGLHVGRLVRQHMAEARSASTVSPCRR